MDRVSFKQDLVNYYNQEAEIRDRKSDKAEWKLQVRENFCSIARENQKKTLLELGAGAGYDSLYFMENGFEVTAVDLSSEMVSRCREKGINAYEMDFYRLSELDKAFDCIYAINTLLHVPKSDLSNVLNEIDKVLAKGGLLYIGMYGGADSEDEFVKADVCDTPRFFALHSREYLEKLLGEHFDIMEFRVINVGEGTEVDHFHSVVMRKR